MIKDMVDILIQEIILTLLLQIITCLIFNSSLINKKNLIWSLIIGAYFYVFVYCIVLCNWRPLVCHSPILTDIESVKNSVLFT
jgi:hypothetical protein